jgi:hypothetical protein
MVAVHCTKISYATQYLAARALVKIQKTQAGRPKQVCAVYPCATHHAWHLTSDRKSASNEWTRKALARFPL